MGWESGKLETVSNTFMSTRKPLLFAILLALTCIFPAALFAKNSVKDLPPRYRTWLNDEVNYIISNDEKDAFLQLPTDDDRNKFMEHFWELRNPTPGAPDNAYKDEIYKRIEYVKQYFHGVHTDMGRIYITLANPSSAAGTTGARKCGPWKSGFTRTPTLPCLPISLSYFSIAIIPETCASIAPTWTGHPNWRPRS